MLLASARHSIGFGVSGWKLKVGFYLRLLYGQPVDPSLSTWLRRIPPIPSMEAHCWIDHFATLGANEGRAQIVTTFKKWH